jgi:hypothetical protein
MTCPSCGKTFPVKIRGAESKYKEDQEKAWKALAALEHVLSQSHQEWIRNGLAAHSDGFGTFRMAVEMEMERLLKFVDLPDKLYAIYRRADKKTPVNYGMSAAS